MSTISKADELVQYLQGTCKSLDEGVREVYGEDFDVNELSDEDTSHLDQEIFLCDTCGWWCEICEEDGEGNCQDCHDSMYEDEEE